MAKAQEITEIGQIPAYDKPESQRRFDETSSLKPSSGTSDSGLS